MTYVINVAGSRKTSLIVYDCGFDFFKSTIKFHNQNHLDLSGLLLLAAIPKHGGSLYKWFGALMEQWHGCTAQWY